MYLRPLCNNLLLSVCSLILALTLWLMWEEVVAGAAPESFEEDAGKVAVLPGFELGSHLSVTYTVYLPIISKGYCDGKKLFGVQMYGEGGFSHVLSAGTKWVRWPISWGGIEPSNTTPDNYNWSYTDASISNFYNAGINLVCTICCNPSWAAIYSEGPITNTADLAEFAGALVERYDGDGYRDAPGSPTVRYWEFYNEPDGGWRGNGAGYAQMLKAVYLAVKAADPHALVVMGGLAYDNWQIGFDRNFLDDVLASGGGNFFDVMNYHYFKIFDPVWASYGRGLIGKANYIRNKMAQYGVNKPLICTETGWFSFPNSSDEEQSRYVPVGFIRGLAAGLDIVIWFSLVDTPELETAGWGLLDLNLNPKPSYKAYKTLISKLSGVCYDRPLSVNETGSSDIEGYLFSNALRVVWTNSEVTREMYIYASQVHQTDKYGNSTIIYDGSDGVLDGRVKVTVGPSPIYLEP